jgi:hypothetical protein
MADYAIGAEGKPIRLIVENASRLSFVEAQLRTGEVAFPYQRDAVDPQNNRRTVTSADAAAAVTRRT